MAATVYLIPCFLYDGVTQTLPPYITEAIKKCSVFYVENERTTRRYFKLLWREMVIDNYEWHTIHKAEAELQNKLTADIKADKTIGIVSEAGCPGIADPGQILIAKAQQLSATLKPLVGPSSILLALMASGMNGQNFCFNGYLPIDKAERKKSIQKLEEQATTTQIFIETPFRNDTVVAELLETCKPQTLLCIATNITAPTETIITKTIAEWKKSMPPLHKKLCIFLLGK